MLLRTFSLIAGLCFVLAGPMPRPADCASPPKAEVGVLLRFDTAPSAVFVSTMERELARIMNSANLKLHWLLPENSDGTQNFARAVIFTFHGDCRAIGEAPRPQPAAARIALAETLAEGSVILPYSETNCDQLRGFLSKEEPYGVGAESRMGFAMARLLAHEMYHVLLQTRAHGERGISRATHTPSALLSRSLKFDPNELSLMRLRVSGRMPGPNHPQTRPPAHEPQQLSFRPN